MPLLRTYLLTSLAMIAFAGNSLLCRWALKETEINAASFTLIRIISGALMLLVILRLRKDNHLASRASAGSWSSALALFTYMTAFSYAYVSLPTGTGALLLFGSVQLTMVLYGLWQGERLHMRQNIGLIITTAGLVWLLFPGIAAPQLAESILMLTAGVAWAIYSLRGKGASDPVSVTAGNFMLAAIFSVVLSLVFISNAKMDATGIALAVVSGAVTSGVGYAIWYSALQGLKTTTAAIVQLSVPVIAAIGGVMLLNEIVTLRLVIASVATLGGIALVLIERGKTI
jgi:drug/metabolite transporter (DMT)-like permease